MTIESTNGSQKRLIVALVGGLIFFLVNILAPYIGFMFGFLEGTIIDDMYGVKWDVKWHSSELEMIYESTPFDSSISYSFTALENSEVEFLWTLLDLWQWIFLVGGIVALVLVIISEIITITGGKQPDLRVSLNSLGFIIGLIASGVEWLLFLLIWVLEDWDTLISGMSNQPDLGFILLILNVVGVIALYLAAKPSILIKG